MPDTVKTNDLKAGTRIVFRDGRTGTLADNKRGNIRRVRVDGPYPESGDCYMHDLYEAEIDGKFVRITLTKAQCNLKLKISNMWGG